MRDPAKQFARDYLNNISKLLNDLDLDVIAEIAEAFETARKNSKKVFFIGNGGSAATASHFANDLATVPIPNGMPPFKAIPLTDHVAAITCHGNDVGYEYIFLGQLKNLMEPGDILVSISASGNSPNILKAVEFANLHGGVTVGFSGFEGGKLKAISRLCLHVPTPKGAYGPVEDIHLIMNHLITSYLRSAIAAVPARESA